MENFISSTITGVELKCKIAIPKNYFTKDFKDVNKKVYYDIGILDSIGWDNVSSTTPKYTLSTTNPYDIASGISMAKGQMFFKTFYRDSLEALKSEIAKGINNGANKILFPVIEDNPFESLENFDEEIVLESHDDANKVTWGSMPLFDIILISKSKDENNVTTLHKKEIQGVRIESQGFAESIESLEMNSIVSFMAIGEITEWEKSGGINNE